MSDQWLKLTEPNGNPIWVNSAQIACMYRTNVGRHTTEDLPHTMIVALGVKVPVTETPEQILAEMRNRDVIAGLLSGASPR